LVASRKEAEDEPNHEGDSSDGRERFGGRRAVFHIAYIIP